MPCNLPGMVNVAASLAAAPPTPCAVSNGVPASGAAPPDSAFSDVLSMTSEAAATQVDNPAAAPPGQASATESKQASVETAEGGEAPPAGGNLLPLAMLLPTPVTMQAQTQIPAEAAAKTAASSPVLVQTTTVLDGAQVAPQLAPQPILTATDDAADDAASLASAISVPGAGDDDALPVIQQTAPSAALPVDAATDPTAAAAAASAAAALNKATTTAAAARLQEAHEATTHKTPAPASASPPPMPPVKAANPAAAAITARLARNSDGADGVALRRVLSSMNMPSGDVAEYATNEQPVVDAPATAPPVVRNAALSAFAGQLAAAAAGAAMEDQGRNLDAALMRSSGDLSFESLSKASVTPQSPVVTSMHGVMLQQTSPLAAATDTPVLQIQTPMTRPEWADGLGDRIIWMTDQNLSNAQIKLNPSHLGPIDVRVSVTDDQTNVWMTAQHGTTREALEAAAPRLRELLSSHGLGNVNVNINQHSSGDRSAQTQRPEPWQSYDQQVNAEFFAASTGSGPPSRALLDTYA